MKKTFIASIFLAFFILDINTISLSQCSLDKTGWTCVFDEPFDNMTDMKTRWTIMDGPDPWIDNQWYRSINTENNIEFPANDPGFGYFYTKKLNPPIWQGTHWYYYSTAKIQSKFEDYQACNTYSTDNGFLWGMFEIRCKLPKIAGEFISYWLTGTNSWPPEIDVFEYRNDNHRQYWSTIHWSEVNDPHLWCGKTYNYPSDLTNDFHTWTLVWTPKHVTWFFDNKELRTDNIDVHIPGSSIYNIGSICQWHKMLQQIGVAVDNPDGNTTYFDPLIVDYIKVYKPTNLTPYSTPAADWFNDIVSDYANTPYKTTSDWLLNRIVTDDPYNAFSDLNVLQGGGKYYYRGGNNYLSTTYWYDWGNGPMFHSAPISTNFTISGNISVATQDEIPFFRRGSKIGYYKGSNFYYIKYNYFPFLVVTNAADKIIAKPNGKEVYYLGTDNNIWHAERATLATDLWDVSKITNSSDFTSDIICDPNDDHIFYCRNTSDKLYKLYINAGSWTTTVISPTNDIHGSLAITSNSEVIFYRNSANKMVYIYLQNGTWTRIEFYAITPYSNGQSVWIDNIASDICLGENPNHIYYIGTDKRVWVVYLDNTWYAAAIDWRENYAERDLRITDFDNANMRLSFVGPDNQIRTLNWNTCENLNPECEQDVFYKTALDAGALDKFKSQATNKIELFPNPAIDEIQLRWAGANKGDKSLITISDLTGKTIKNIESLSNEIKISITDIPNGVYIVKVINGSNVLSTKFVKE